MLNGNYRAVKRLGTTLAVVFVLATPAAARADVVLDWNAIAVTVTAGQNPFNQARLLAITQLAVFEAVNAITHKFDPYLGTIVAPAGANADAAAITAAHDVLKNYFPASGPALDGLRDSALAAIPNGTAKAGGISTGQAAAAAMITLRLNDGSAIPEFYVPGAMTPGAYQLTPSCLPPFGPGLGGLFLHWPNVTPFGIETPDDFLLDPPPALTSKKFAKDYNEVKTVGSATSVARPQDRADVVMFYAASSPGFVLNSVARQAAVEQGRSISHNARALALLNMAINDSLISSFANKYHYNFWRPETAIRAGDTDGNPRTDPDTSFMPFILTPCFPSYPSNHGSGTSGGVEVLRRIYGAGGHTVTLTNPFVSGLVTLHYTNYKEIVSDVDDARIYGGIHYRFDQDAGGKLGRGVATYIYRHNLRRDNGHDHHHHDNDCDDDERHGGHDDDGN